MGLRQEVYEKLKLVHSVRISMDLDLIEMFRFQVLFMFPTH